MVGNTGYRRSLRTLGDGHFVIDRAKAEEDSRIDGVFVLRTKAVIGVDLVNSKQTGSGQ